jgi:hypothetical protein
MTFNSITRIKVTSAGTIQFCTDTPEDNRLFQCNRRAWFGATDVPVSVQIGSRHPCCVVAVCGFIKHTRNRFRLFTSDILQRHCVCVCFHGKFIFLSQSASSFQAAGTLPTLLIHTGCEKLVTLFNPHRLPESSDSVFNPHRLSHSLWLCWIHVGCQKLVTVQSTQAARKLLTLFNPHRLPER